MWGGGSTSTTESLAKVVNSATICCHFYTTIRKATGVTDNQGISHEAAERQWAVLSINTQRVFVDVMTKVVLKCESKRVLSSDVRADKYRHEGVLFDRLTSP